MYPAAAPICTKCTGRPCLQRQVNSCVLAYWPQMAFFFTLHLIHKFCDGCKILYYLSVAAPPYFSDLFSPYSLLLHSSRGGLLGISPAHQARFAFQLCIAFSSPLCTAPPQSSWLTPSPPSRFCSDVTLATFLKTVICLHMTLAFLISIPFFSLCYLIVIILPSNILCNLLIFAYLL